MSELSKITEIMEQKRQLLSSIEDATQEMITCHSQKLEDLMIRREKLVSELKKSDEELKKLCEEREDGAAILDASVGKGDAGAYPEVYGSAQQHRAIFRRLRESELQAMLRLKQEQLEILEKIKATNHGGAAKAARFFSVGSSQGGFSRLGKA